MDLGMPLVQVVLPSDGVVDQQGNPNQEGHAHSDEHDRIHGSISFLFRFFRFCNEGSNKGDEKARNGYYPNPFRTFLKEEAYETCSQDDLSKVSKHSRQSDSFFRTQHLFRHKQLRLYHGLLILTVLFSLLALASPAEAISSAASGKELIPVIIVPRP